MVYQVLQYGMPLKKLKEVICIQRGWEKDLRSGLEKRSFFQEAEIKKGKSFRENGGCFSLMG